MGAIIDAAFRRNRTVIISFLFILISGSLAYISIPKEAEPDVTIPIIYVSMNHEGISPEDGERLLIKPMEKELQSIEGIKEMTSTASEGHASVMLEFYAGFDSKQALLDVREKVDMAKSKLPSDTEEPAVNEINVALFPVITVSLAGPIPERSLLKIARALKDDIEAQANVLEVNIGGDREEVMEVIVDPVVLETYNIQFDQLFSLVNRNNLLVAAGAVDTGSGRMVLKVPGVVETVNDMIRMPVKVAGNTVVTLGDVASIRSTYKDPEGFARINGQPALVLEVKKRLGANIIETIESVRAIVEQHQRHWPETLAVTFLQDKSQDIRSMLADLQNNVVSAIALVMIVIIGVLGARSSLLVGLAIPGSFLAGILIISYLGFTMNIVVLFSLILVVGMLVDGAIIVTELADRKIDEGMTTPRAFAAAAKRMSWPIIASTITTLVVFLPLLFWPGVVGQFMKYLPITVLVCLIAALFMSLIFIPVLGGSLGRRTKSIIETERRRHPFTRMYTRLLLRLLQRPGITFLTAIALMVGTYVAYGMLGRGVEFFPDVDINFAQVQIHSRGDLSIYEKDALLKQVESRIAGMPEVHAAYARSFNTGTTDNRAEDVIGVVQLEFVDWQLRRDSKLIIEEIRQNTADIPGVMIEVRKQENGPSQGKPIQLQVSSYRTEKLAPTVAKIRQVMNEIGGFVDAEDDRPLPGIEWRLEVDRELAARYGADVSLLGNAVQMITYGINVAEYRPDYSDEEVDIRVRFPFNERSLDKLDEMRIYTERGAVPISNFVKLQPAQKTGTIKRSDGQRVITIQADAAEGLLVDDQVKKLRAALTELPADPDLRISFKGEDKDQREAMQFLIGAFLTALFLMLIVLVTQFNSIYQSFLVLSAIVFSTSGVLLGLLITGQTFGIVMVGIGIIALAGIVVNNNIVLIDTYNEMRYIGMDAVKAAVKTGALRLRPVLLTAITTVLGLLPMVLALNIDLINRDITFGAPSTQWWTQLASAIAGGLSFATILTLIVTPALLVLGDRLGKRFAALRLRVKAPRFLRSNQAAA